MVNVLSLLGRLVSHNPDDDNLKTKLVDFFSDLSSLGNDTRLYTRS